MLFGLVQFAEALKGRAEVVGRLRKMRLAGERLPVAGGGLGQAAGAAQHKAQVVVDLGMVRFPVEQLTVQRLGLGEPAGVLQLQRAGEYLGCVQPRHRGPSAGPAQTSSGGAGVPN